MSYFQHYAEAPVEANVVSLFDKKQVLTFNDIANGKSHKLYDLLPRKNFSNYSLQKELRNF